jgi:2-iminobutanoate/2-iminopropanoate deaminase
MATNKKKTVKQTAKKSAKKVAKKTAKKAAKKSAKKDAKKTAKKAAKKSAKKVAKKTAPLGPYTPVVRAGDWVIVSGQLGVVDGKIVKGGVAAQTAQAIVNLKSQLASAGVTINDVKKTLCFLTDMDTFGTFNTAYVEGFVTSRPARSTIGVASLPFGGAVEIEAWAFKPLR